MDDANPGDETQAAPGDEWYRQQSGELEQGDIVLSFRLVAPFAGQTGDYEFRARHGRVVILTQSCDIPKSAQRNLMLAEVHDYDTMVKAGNSHLAKKDYKQALARGTAISDFLLPPSPDGRIGWSLVSFRDVFIVPKEVISLAAKSAEMLRLASPYREYLSQAFGRFLMRVGLPATLSEFENYKAAAG